MENIGLLNKLGIGKYLKKIKEYVDANIQYIETTYDNLVSLRNNSQLIPGKQYRIIDYVTTTNQLDTLSAGHQFDIIVTADNENTLNEKARAIQHDGDTYFANSNLAAWQIWYKLDNDDNYAWVGETDIVETTDEDGLIYQQYFEDFPIVNFPIIDSEQSIRTNPFYSLDNSFNQESIYDGYFDSYAIEIKNEGIDPELKRIYYEIVEKGNISDIGTDKYGNYFVSDKKHYVNDSWVVDIFGKEYYYANDADLIVPIDYKIGDIVYRYEFMVHSAGTVRIIKANKQKGIIYRMIDEYNNECPYDFKNILYLESEGLYVYGPGYYYTFSKYDEAENIITDNSTNDGWNSKCNIIKEYKQNNKIYLNNIKLICHGNIYNECNEFDYDCSNISIASGSSGNKFIGSNYQIQINADCSDNIFYSSHRIYLRGGECSRNTFKQYCYDITLNGVCRNNTFEQICSNISITESHDNIFNQSCNRIFFTEVISDSIFEPGVSYIRSYDSLSHLYVDSSVHFTSYQKLPTISDYPSGTKIRITKGSDNNIKIYCEADMVDTTYVDNTIANAITNTLNTEV